MPSFLALGGPCWVLACLRIPPIHSLHLSLGDGRGEREDLGEEGAVVSPLRPECREMLIVSLKAKLRCVSNLGR